MLLVYGRWLLRSSSQEALGQESVQVAPAAAISVAMPINKNTTRIALGRELHRTLNCDPFLASFAETAKPTKPLTASETEKKETDAEEQIRRAADELELQSTICGGSPLASINGHVVRRGDVINGFMVEEIKPEYVVIRQDNVRMKLRMK